MLKQFQFDVEETLRWNSRAPSRRLEIVDGGLAKLQESHASHLGVLWTQARALVLVLSYQMQREHHFPPWASMGVK